MYPHIIWIRLLICCYMCKNGKAIPITPNLNVVGKHSLSAFVSVTAACPTSRRGDGGESLFGDGIDSLLHSLPSSQLLPLLPNPRERYPPTDPLSPNRAAEYRSLVGVAMYLAQERFDLQYATKTLANHLQQPTTSAWNALGRLKDI